MGELNLDKIDRALLQEWEDKYLQEILSPDEERETVETIQSKEPVLTLC